MGNESCPRLSSAWAWPSELQAARRREPPSCARRHCLPVSKYPARHQPALLGCGGGGGIANRKARVAAHRHRPGAASALLDIGLKAQRGRRAALEDVMVACSRGEWEAPPTPDIASISRVRAGQHAPAAASANASSSSMWPSSRAQEIVLSKSLAAAPSCVEKRNGAQAAQKRN